jgi:hypothetical protein
VDGGIWPLERIANSFIRQRDLGDAVKIEFDLPPPLPNQRVAQFHRRAKKALEQIAGTTQQGDENPNVLGSASNRLGGTADSIHLKAQPPGSSTRPLPAPWPQTRKSAENTPKAATSTDRIRRNIDLLFGAITVLVVGLVCLSPLIVRHYDASHFTQSTPSGNGQPTGGSGNTALLAQQPSSSPRTDAQLPTHTRESDSSPRDGSGPTASPNPFPTPSRSPGPNVTEISTPSSRDEPTSQALKEADKALNEEYEELRRSLNKEDKESLKREEIRWLGEREKVRNEASEYLGMTWERVQDLNHRHTHSGE